MLIEVLVQELLELLLLLLDAGTETDERRQIAHVVDSTRLMLRDQCPAAFGQVGHERVDHAPDRFVNQAAVQKGRILGFDRIKMPREYPHRRQLLDRYQARTQSVVDVMIVVGDFVGQIGNLRFQRGPLFPDEAFADFPQLLRVFEGAVLQDSFTGLETQIQPFEGGIALLQHIDDTQRLQVVLEAAVVFHAFVERVLAGVAEGRMPEVVRQRNGFDQVFVEPEITRHGTADLRDFDAVGQAGTKQVAFMIHENLGLVLEASKSRGMDDAIAVALELRPADRRCFRYLPATGFCRIGGVSRQFNHAPSPRRGLRASHATQNPTSRKPCPAIEAGRGATFHPRLFCRAP